MSRLRSIYRALGLRRRVEKIIKRASEGGCGVAVAPQMRDRNLMGLHRAINNLHANACQQDIEHVYSNARGCVVEVDRGCSNAVENISKNAGQICNARVGLGLVAHDGDYLGTADRGWVFKAGQWVELSKAELLARRIASLRGQLAQAEAEAA